MNETTDAPEIFAPIWKRKWLILAVGLLVAAGTYVYYKRQPHVYAASTQLYLGSGAEEQAQITGAGSASKKASSTNATNQAALIDTSLVKEAVHRRLRSEHKRAVARVALHGKTHATAKEKSNFITITTQARTAQGAALLANVTAQAYVNRQNANYQRGIEKAIALARRQLRRIEATQAAVPVATPKGKNSGKSAAEKSAGKSSSVSTAVTLQAATLSAKINQLESEQSIVGVKQIEPAKASRAELLAPKPRKNAIFGFAIGVVLATFAAYALNRLDRRLRSLSGIEKAFGSQILTALPAVRRPIVEREGEPGPAKSLREPVRRLHMSLEMGPADALGILPSALAGTPNALGEQPARRPRVILFVSADPGDGKSTVVANLALAQRDADIRVAIIEADFRRPVLSKLLGIAGPQGLAEVLEGKLAVGQAMRRVGRRVPATKVNPAASASGGLATLVEPSGTGTGSVSVLLGSEDVANPPALIAHPAMTELLASLAEEFDYVLIDAPVPLQVSDVMPLLRAADGIVIVARVGHTSETSARRLVQLLSRTSSAPVLGVVANAVPSREIEKYGFSAAGQKSRWGGKLLGR